MLFGKLDIDPAYNPAILDTETWAPDAARAILVRLSPAERATLRSAAEDDRITAQPGASVVPYPASRGWHAGSRYCLARLSDRQRVFLRFGPTDADSPLGAPLLPPIDIAEWAADSDTFLSAYPTDAAMTHRFCRDISPGAGPVALGPIPRLGIGTRMTTAVWPAIWEAMAQHGFAANAIQNSVRELNLLPNLLNAAPPETNVAFGFGAIQTGYTGSTFEGLWAAGTLDALAHRAKGTPRYGADADHIQVKRGAGGLERAKGLVDAARYYSFYTLDVSDVLNYAALSASPADAEAILSGSLPDATARRAFLAYHRAAADVADVTLGRLVGKYWAALNAVESLAEYINRLKQGEAYDLELSIDEHPLEVATFDCLTSAEELAFLLREAQRRGLRLTHIAPNFGVEKGVDYSCPDGLLGLEARCRNLSQLAADFGVMVDFHSGDDLSATTRQVIGRATEGRHQFKVSPMLQLIFADMLAEHDPALFRGWQQDALDYARAAAAGGSAFAARCIGHDEAGGALLPAAHGEVFHHFSFAFVGRRDADGQFINREAFYRLPSAFYRDYRARIVAYLGELAHDLF
jgi:hypothetical protein